jgi:cytochrome c oxidase subunit 2
MPPALGRPTRRFTVLAALALALVALLALAPSALADFWTPEDGGSPNADKIDTLYKVILALGAIVFIGVTGVLLYSCFKFRARKGLVAAQIRGNTRLEIGWTVGAALLLVVIAVVTFAFLPSIEDPPNSDASGFQAASSQGVLYASGPEKRLPPNGKSLNICVNGQQYVWRYTYAKDCTNAPRDAVFSYTEMVVPVATTVTLDIYAQDVIHSWWIPALGGKFDAVPGYTNHTWFKVPEDKAGTTFDGQCAELCGRNHANMVASVRAVTPDEFEAWADAKRREIQQADAAAAESRKKIEADPQGNP